MASRRSVNRIIFGALCLSFLFVLASSADDLPDQKCSNEFDCRVAARDLSPSAPGARCADVQCGRPAMTTTHWWMMALHPPSSADLPAAGQPERATTGCPAEAARQKRSTGARHNSSSFSTWKSLATRLGKRIAAQWAIIGTLQRVFTAPYPPLRVEGSAWSFSFLPQKTPERILPQPPGNWFLPSYSWLQADANLLPLPKSINVMRWTLLEGTLPVEGPRVDSGSPALADPYWSHYAELDAWGIVVRPYESPSGKHGRVAGQIYSEANCGVGYPLPSYFLSNQLLRGTGLAAITGEVAQHEGSRSFRAALVLLEIGDRVGGPLGRCQAAGFWLAGLFRDEHQLIEQAGRKIGSTIWGRPLAEMYRWIECGAHQQLTSPTVSVDAQGLARVLVRSLAASLRQGASRVAGPVRWWLLPEPNSEALASEGGVHR